MFLKASQKCEVFFVLQRSLYQDGISFISKNIHIFSKVDKYITNLLKQCY